MKKIAFIGNVFPESYDEYFKDKGIFNFSSVIFNNLFVKELNKTVENLSIISAVGVGHYPIQSNIKKIDEIKIRDNYWCVSYKNFIGFNVFSKANSIVKKAIEIGAVYNKNDIVIVSEASIPFLKAAKKLKRKFGCKICLMVMDLPEHIKSDKRWSFYNLLKSISNLLAKRYYKRIDYFAFLTNKMNSVINTYNRPYIVFPTIINPDLYCGLIKRKHKHIVITYCGSISKRFDIDFLLESFVRTKNPELRLVIAGGGDGVSIVENYLKIDQRIKYLGIVTRQKSLQLQLDSDYLINPRRSGHDYSSYSFPSKIAQYLLSLNPVISYVNESFPSEIKKLLIVPKDESNSTLTVLLDSLEKPKNIQKDKILKTLQKYTADELVSELFKLFH